MNKTLTKVFEEIREADTVNRILWIITATVVLGIVLLIAWIGGSYLYDAYDRATTIETEQTKVSYTTEYGGYYIHSYHSTWEHKNGKKSSLRMIDFEPDMINSSEPRPCICITDWTDNGRWDFISIEGRRSIHERKDYCPRVVVWQDVFGNLKISKPIPPTKFLVDKFRTIVTLAVKEFNAFKKEI